MLRTNTSIAIIGMAGFIAFAQPTFASTVPEESVQFNVTADPIDALSDSIFQYGIGSNGAAGNVPIGNFPANQTTTNTAVIQLPNGVLNLEPTYTYFSLYTATIGNQLVSQGICVAINQADYATAAGETFDQLFGTNIDAAFNDGQTHTEADLINEFDTTGTADQYFTAGITNTPAADIPYNQSGPLVLFSDGTNGGTIYAYATVVPEPTGLEMGLIGAATFFFLRLLGRKSRNSI